MKFIVERDRMADAMSAVMRQAKNSLVIPILHNVLLDAKESKLQISACNLDSYSQAICPAEVSEAGACTVPASSLNGLLSELPEGSQVTITLTDGRAHLKSGRCQYRLPTLPASDFPNAFKVNNGVKVTLAQQEVKRLFALQQHAISTDKQRISLQGTCLQMEDHRLVGVATNAFTLFRTSLPYDLNGAASIIVPKDAITAILAFDDGQVELEWSEQIFAIKSDIATFATKLIDAKFPPHYQQLIPDATGPCLIVEREELRGMIARLRAAADEATEISLHWDDDPVEISGRVADLAEGEDCIACEGEGMKAGKIIFAPSRVSNLLSTLTADKLCIFVPGPVSAVRFADPQDTDLIVLEMPIAPRGGPV